MSTSLDNVVFLADVRREREEEWEAPLPARPRLRLVRSDEPVQRFSLEVFLRRAQIVLAETAVEHPIGA